MLNKVQITQATSPVSRRQAIVGLAALVAVGSGITSLRSVAARENEPGDDHGGRGKDDGRRHRRHRHGRRHKQDRAKIQADE